MRVVRVLEGFLILFLLWLQHHYLLRTLRLVLLRRTELTAKTLLFHLVESSYSDAYLAVVFFFFRLLVDLSELREDGEEGAEEEDPAVKEPDPKFKSTLLA